MPDFAFCKLEISIPKSYLGSLRQARQEVDEGRIGNCDCCLSDSPVTGCRRPLAVAAPYLGAEGDLRAQAERKVEAARFPEQADKMVQAVKPDQPYEEPPIRVIPLYRTSLWPGHCHAYPH